MSFRDTARFSGKLLWVWVAVVLFVLAMALIVMLLTGVFKKETADFRGDVKQTEQVQADPNYRISHYDQFFDECASIQTLTTQLQQAESDLQYAVTSDEKRDARTNVTALRNMRTEAINQYNANAAKTDTAANFRSSSLPYRIDPNAEVIECAA